MLTHLEAELAQRRADRHIARSPPRFIALVVEESRGAALLNELEQLEQRAAAAGSARVDRDRALPPAISQHERGADRTQTMLQVDERVVLPETCGPNPGPSALLIVRRENKDGEYRTPRCRRRVESRVVC